MRKQYPGISEPIRVTRVVEERDWLRNRRDRGWEWWHDEEFRKMKQKLIERYIPLLRESERETHRLDRPCSIDADKVDFKKPNELSRERNRKIKQLKDSWESRRRSWEEWRRRKEGQLRVKDFDLGDSKPLSRSVSAFRPHPG